MVIEYRGAERGVRPCDLRQMYEERLKPEAPGTEPFFSLYVLDFPDAPRPLFSSNAQ